VPFDSLPYGPDDGRVRQQSVDTLATLFKQLFTSAPAAHEMWVFAAGGASLTRDH